MATALRVSGAPTRRGSAAVGLATIVAVLLASTVAAAVDSSSFTVKPRTYRRLTQAHELIGEENYQEATELTLEALEDESLSAHEQALLLQTLAFIYSALEQFGKATNAFEKCLKLNAMPEATQNNTEYNLGQVYMAAGRYDQAVRVFARWLTKTKKPTPGALYLIAGAYAQTESFRTALSHAKAAVAAKSRPPENWLKLLMSLHFELKELRAVRDVLKRLLLLYPNKNNWLQLSSVYSELDDEKRALAVMELAHREGYVTERPEILRLASMYAASDLPFQAAKTVQSGIDAGAVEADLDALKKLAGAWSQAREYPRAIPPLKRAGDLADNGDLYVQLAQLHSEQQRWKDVVEAADLALEKGSLTWPGRAQLLRGIAQFSLSRYSAARRSFKKASEQPPTHQAAMQWLTYVKQKSSL